MNNDDQKRLADDLLSTNNKKINDTSSDDVDILMRETDVSKKDKLYNGILHDLAKRSAEHKANGSSLLKKEINDNVVSSLHNEINDLIGGKKEINDLKKIQDKDFLDSETVNKKDVSSKKGSPSIIAALSAVDKFEDQSLIHNDVLKKENVDKTINFIKEDIKKELGIDKSKIKNEEDLGNVLDENTKNLIEKQEKKKGIEETYYSDLSEAMGSNKPETMYELLEKAKYEKKEKTIRSPMSKRNMAYIVGAALLLIGIIGIIFFFFFYGKKEVKYITEKRVKSLVYSDLDTGINVSNIDAEKTKQAIRKVLETKIKEGKLNQVYYAGKDQFGNLRRLGVKQVFKKTGNIPPDLLYQNIENEFMHGVYKTDKNRPFIILKALSYDRAFEGMKEWEGTMIDDLATYLDLPKDAGDRSLMEDGFSDDIIKNKNVRVARFLPREVDRRKGTWNVIDPADIKKENSETSVDKQAQDGNIEDKKEEEVTMLDGTISYIDSLFKNKFVYAQTSNNVTCYKTKKACYDFYGKEVGCDGKYETSRIIQVFNEKEDDYKKVYANNDPEMLKLVKSNDLSCINSIDGTDVIGNTLDETKPIICYKISKQCVDTNGNPVSEDYSGKKSCHNVIFNEKFDTVYGPEKYGQDGFACINSIESSGFAGDNISGDDIVCYLSHKKCVDSFGKIAYYSPGDTSIICNDIISNGPGDTIFPGSYFGKPGYSCFSGSSSTPLEYNDALVNSQGSWSWLLDLFFQDNTLTNGGPIQPGQTLKAVNVIQNELVLLGLMNSVSISSKFDLLTQDIISHFQLVNGLPQTGNIDEDTINLLRGIISGQGSIFGGSQAAIINDYIPINGNIGIGTYSENVQTIQTLLFIGGYNISRIDGVFDKEVCSAMQAYQKDNGLNISNDKDCMIDSSTIDMLNKIISTNDYLGSGFIINGNGYLVGSGVLQGINGPGAIGFEVNKADADSLNEGDIVLMYTFLDEHTILITRSEEVITEIIKRRALNDIFNKS